MKWRYVAVRVLSFVAGAAGIVLLTFVVFPWLQGRNEPVHQVMSSDSISEEVFASFGEVAGADGETERQSMEPKDVLVVPLPVFPVAGDNPAPILGMDAPVVAAPEEWGTAPAQGDGFQQALSPGELEAVVLELRRPASVSDVEVDDSQSPVDWLQEEAEALEASSSAAAVHSATEEWSAEAVTGAVDVAESIRGEPLPAESVRDSQPLHAEVFRQTNPAGQSSRAGMRRLEFETPENLRFGEPTQGAGNMREGAEPTAPVAPLSEFSPRHSPGSVLSATQVLESPAGSGEQDENRRAESLLVPETLRGAMGYRLPLISRQELPDQVVSGVLIPAHTTYVILKPGYWELVELSPDDARAMGAAADKATAGGPLEAAEPAARSWNPFRLFRTKRPAGVEN